MSTDIKSLSLCNSMKRVSNAHYTEFLQILGSTRPNLCNLSLIQLIMNKNEAFLFKISVIYHWVILHCTAIHFHALRCGRLHHIPILNSFPNFQVYMPDSAIKTFIILKTSGLTRMTLMPHLNQNYRQRVLVNLHKLRYTALPYLMNVKRLENKLKL